MGVLLVGPAASIVVCPYVILCGRLTIDWICYKVIGTSPQSYLSQQCLVEGYIEAGIGWNWNVQLD